MTRFTTTEAPVTSYRVTLKDRSVEQIDQVDAYQQEGAMTTFFRTASGRRVVDTWSTRVASIRTSEIVVIRRLETGSVDPCVGLAS